MGRWAQAKRRGGRHLGLSAGGLFPAPLLALKGPLLLEWVPNSPDPFAWVIMESAAEGGPYEEFDAVDGSLRTYELPGGGVWAYTFGRTQPGLPYTESSNKVFVPV